ncbi:hypothetical protein OIU35_10065 [Boseaceae bacterium BT-24-1]|nr:hypothetical protein [Boseaceae bacterium BT-24-1]
MNMTSWLLIDDSPEEAASFARSLSLAGKLQIDHLSAREATAALDKGQFAPQGVLMDVDLSNEMGQRQTGPGMSQDMRVAQQKRALPSFPIVRFSLRNKILENIGRDPSSDDVFDLKIEKDGLSDERTRLSAQYNLMGVRGIYDALEGADQNLLRLVGLNDVTWQQWGSSSFQADFESGDRIFLKASPIVRMMVYPGLLIDEDILAFRLGINRAASTGWATLLKELADYAYRGIVSDCFVRWWARGIEQWWQDTLHAEAPLAGSSIEQRIALLSGRFGNLVPLTMPKGSMGNRPWRYCLLTREQRQELIPVDPSRAPKLKPRSPMPSWLDPFNAALGVALQNRDDPRLDKDDLRRLQPLVRT